MSSQSSVSLTTEYNSNPYLVESGPPSEAEAVVLDLPASYKSDWQSFDIDPRVREGETQGASQLLSNYQYLDAIWHVSGERSSLTVDAGLHRDSTLYNQFENAVLVGHDLPRLQDSADLSWQHSLSERANVQVSGSWSRVDYTASSGLRLDNYNSTQFSASYARSLSELWQWTSSVGLQRYAQSGLDSSSDDKFLQTSSTGALSERWTITAQGGYSFLHSDSQGYACCRIVRGPDGYLLQYIPVRQDTSGGSASYLLNLQRTGERLTLAGSVSQSIQPSSLGAALRSDLITLNASLSLNERLALSAVFEGSQQSNPLQRTGAVGSRRYYSPVLGATWLWTEHWTLALQTGYTLQRTSSISQGSGYSVTLSLSRQFGRLNF